MRNDLLGACVHCSLRLPVAMGACPRCRLRTTSPRQALAALGNLRANVQVSRPLRDALLYVPAALLYVVSAGAAVFVAVELAWSIGRDAGGMGVAVAFIALLAMFAGGLVVLAVPWGLWAIVVSLVAWIFGRKRRPVLRPAPVVAGTDGRADRGPDRLERARRWLRRAGFRQYAVAIALLLAAELVAELVSKTPFGGEDLGGALSLIGGTLLAQVVALVILAMPLAVAAQAWEVVETKLRLLAQVWRERSRDQDLLDARRGLDRLREGRTPVRGPARPATGAPCIAPLSGRPCLGFRLVGRTGDARIDDAELRELVIRAGEEEVVVRPRTVVLALPEPEIAAVSPEQRERVATFLAARELALADDAQLGESLLVEGAEVVVHGTESSEPAAGTGYRTASTRRVLDDADGRPVLVEP